MRTRVGGRMRVLLVPGVAVGARDARGAVHGSLPRGGLDDERGVADVVLRVVAGQALADEDCAAIGDLRRRSHYCDGER